MGNALIVNSKVTNALWDSPKIILGAPETYKYNMLLPS